MRWSGQACAQHWLQSNGWARPWALWPVLPRDVGRWQLHSMCSRLWWPFDSWSRHSPCKGILPLVVFTLHASGREWSHSNPELHRNESRYAKPRGRWLLRWQLMGQASLNWIRVCYRSSSPWLFPKNTPQAFQKKQFSIFGLRHGHTKTQTAQPQLLRGGLFCRKTMEFHRIPIYNYVYIYMNCIYIYILYIYINTYIYTHARIRYTHTPTHTHTYI